MATVSAVPFTHTYTQRFVSVRFFIVITQLRVTIETNYQALTCCMNVGYVAGHERVSSLSFKCIVSIL
jgi:hypothetical protein